MLRTPEVINSSIFFESNGSNKILLFSDLVDRLTGPDYRYSQIQAIEYIRKLIENEELILITDSFLVAFYRDRNISDFEDKQRRLQQAWLRADEITILNVLCEERKEIEAETKLLPASVEEQAEERRYRGGRRPKKKMMEVQAR